MKISQYLVLGFLVISLTPVWGQITFSDSQQPTSETTNLIKFNLDFSGGTPAVLVKAIEKAMGKPLNVIIPTEDADVELPSLKMNDVNIDQLFVALHDASYQTKYYVRNGNAYSSFNISFGFDTSDKPIADNSVWYFREDNKPPNLAPVQICRFYQLAPYLDRGLTVDDITTAIQTGWKMMGEISPPEISFHKETKLLIAVGEPDKLEVIDNVLKALQPPPQDPADLIRSSLNQVRNQELQSHAPPAPARFEPSPRLPGSGASALSPEEQVILMERARQNSLQSTNLVAPTPPPPLKPEAGQ
jgi:hypothetical protein